MSNHKTKNALRDYSHIPKVVIKRLSKYHSVLEKLDTEGIKNVSSQNLSHEVHVKASQLRKDLAYFGEFGTRGKGYDVSYLHGVIGDILGLKKEWAVVLAGLGHLGYALVSYRGLEKKGFKIAGIFESDPKKIGRNVHGMRIYSIDDIGRVVKDSDVKIGIITVPVDAAQKVCDAMVDAGIKAILNFAPVILHPRKPIFVEIVDISGELSILSHYLTFHAI